MSKRILLVNPWIYDFKAYDSWIKPLGLLYIGSILRNNGYEVYLLDCMDRTDESLPIFSQQNDKFNCGQYYREEISKPESIKHVPRKYKKYGIKEERFIELLKSFPEPDVIIVTSQMTYWYPGVFNSITILKKMLPGKPVILGGIYATLCFDHASKFSGADYICAGNFNQQTLDIIDKICGYTSKQNFHKIFSVRPAYHLYKKIFSISMITSLGCPFNCTYCASKLLQPEYCSRSISDILDEIEFYYYQYKINHIAFYDDALLFNSNQHIELILDKIISNKLNINFYTPNGLHASFITQSLAEKMKKAGFNELRVSLETANTELQINTGGKIFNDEFKQAISCLKKAGFNSSEIGIYLLVGLPEQKYDDIYQTIEFVHNEGLKIKLVNYSPLPGTDEWAHLPKELQKKIIDDPIFQNDIVFSFLTSSDIKWKESQEIKFKVLELNGRIRR